nr:G-type lectin S-receptor-like serine/threonine-protein kinase At4g27290 isoform X1 [Ipomoea batatas]
MELRLNSSSLWVSLFFFFINSPEISVGSNVLTAAGKSLTLAVTLVSENGTFEMGFFTPGQSSYYAGIWYKQISPQTVIWVANREAPISSPDMDSAQLNIKGGNLVLTTGSGNSIWSTNLTSPRNSVQATLLETGNLVISDGPYSNATPPLWQSFDYPADTLMPHARLGYNKRTNEKQSLISWRNSEDPWPGPYSLEMDPTIEQYVVKWNGIEQYWSSGPWDGRAFKDIPNPMYNFSYVDNVNESYSTYFLNDPSVLSRLTITVTGQIQLFTWSNSGSWQSVFSRPEKQCDVYASCGPFGVCNENSSSVCECLPGFTIKSDKDWRLKDFSGGCARNVKLQCPTNASAPKDHFDPTTNMKLPRQPQNVTVRSSEQCESFCLRNCSCTAYAYDSNNGCLIWNDEFLILSKDDRNGSTIQIRLAGAEHGAVQVGNHKSSGKLKAIIPATIAGVILVVCVIFYIYYRHRRNAKHRENESNNQEIQLHEAYDDSDREGMIEEHDEKGIDVPFFSFESILVATNNFSDANKLGRGGFGPVYKGVFEGGREIAVKRLSNESGQGSNEFKNEVILIAKLQHRNLVRLLGYCIKGKEKILLYEYMPNKSLDTWIFEKPISTNPIHNTKTQSFKKMADTRRNEFQDMLPVMADKLGGEGLIRELCNGFRLLMDREKEVITFESLKKNSALLGLQDLRDDELRSMVKEGDMDGDGALDQMEFCVLMFRLSPELMHESEALLQRVLQQDLKTADSWFRSN